jgi:hypothetical protein
VVCIGFFFVLLGYDLVYEKKAFIKPEIEKFISWIVSEKKNN